MPSARQFCTRALKSIGIVDPGETPDAEDILDAFDVLNDMVDAWAADGTTIYIVERRTFNLSAGVGTYTLGSGATLNHARPPLPPSRASIISNANPASPHEIPLKVLDIREWQRIPLKSTQSTLPRKIYTDNAFPNRNVNLYPVPSTADPDLVLYLPTALSEFADLDTSYSFPPGYRRAIRYNLARELAPDYDITDGDIPEVIRMAAQFLADIQRINIAGKDETIPVDAALTRMDSRMGYYDIEVDE